MKNDNYHLGQLFWPVSQIDIQCIMLGFLVEGHIYWGCNLYWPLVLMYHAELMVDMKPVYNFLAIIRLGKLFRAWLFDR